VRHIRSIVVLALGLFAVASFAAEPSAGSFPLKNGDVWVMAGDSITAQHLHSNYFEAFCYARYPKMKFAFRNSGVGGHTIPTTLNRFEYDVAAWKPTVVSVELGMNDAGNTPAEQFIANMGTMVARIRDIKARPVIFSASPVNDGSTLTDLKQRNQRLHDYATTLKSFCEKEQIPYADQFHALVNIWGKNKVYESIAALKPLAADESLAGVEHLRAFLAAQAKVPVTAVSLLGDPVHPGPPGQLMMAAALLKALGAEGFVSTATVDAAGKLVEAKGCAVSEIKTTATGGVSFTRLDECLPFPIPDNTRAVLPLAPDVFALSQYTLKVTGLKGGDYRVIVNEVPSSRVTAAELAAGVNLTALEPDPQHKATSPIVAQSRAILSAVSAKEQIVSAWREQSRRAHASGAAPELKEQLAAQTRRVEDADAQIREAAKPQKLKFEIAPVP
jgi:lysophospholipase L1-like esterase